MARYLIKATYESGIHKGKTYLLRKGGYVTDEIDFQWDDTTYKSRAIAERQCKRLKEENDLNYVIERRENEYRISKGKKGKDWFIYDMESYEPYEVPEEMMV